MKSARCSGFAVVLVALVTASSAWAQDSAAPMSVADAQRLVEQMNAALEKRDAVILELVGRVRTLEDALLAREEPVVSVRPGSRPELDTATLRAEEELDEADRLAQSALERTLIDAGGLLLPAGVIEIEPSFTYGLSAIDTIDIDCLLIADILCIGDINSKRFRRESYLANLTLRLGLPWDMQFEVRAPFGHDTTTAVFGDGSGERADTTELGDIEVALSRQLVRERGWRPDLLAEIRWKGQSGNDPFDVQQGSLATGTGFDDLKLGFTLVKVRDPVVLFSNVSYTHTSADDKPEIGELQPGSTVAAQLGLAVALNLETSINFGWTQSWTRRTRLDGEKILGSSRRPGSLNIGGTYVPTAGSSINFDVSFGLTDDAPDVMARFSYPLRLQQRILFGE
jgi:hypothetical protein